MPENTPPRPLAWAPPTPPRHGVDARQTVGVALAATAVLAAGWGLASGLTGRHYTVILPVLGAVLAVALTSTTARRTWFPYLAAALGFAVGYLGDIAAGHLTDPGARRQRRPFRL
jgi:O-antigen ligase